MNTSFSTFDDTFSSFLYKKFCIIILQLKIVSAETGRG